MSAENPDRIDTIKKLHAASLLHGRFLLRSGQYASNYFDKYQFESDPALLAPLGEWLTELVVGQADIFAGLELGGVPLATAMSLRTGIPAAYVRKRAKGYGTCKAVEGPNVSGRRVVVVEDVVTTGGQLIESVGLLRDAGAIVDTVVCVIWRGEDQTRVRDAGLELRWLLTPADFTALGIDA